MNETKDISKTGVFSNDNNVEIDYSSSSGIDSKRDSSDDNCSEINLKLIVNDQISKMNGDESTPSSAEIDCEKNSKPKQARFLVNNVGSDEKGNRKFSYPMYFLLNQKTNFRHVLPDTKQHNFFIEFHNLVDTNIYASIYRCWVIR